MKGKTYKRKEGWVVISDDEWYWSAKGYKKRKQEIPIHPDYVGYFLSEGMEVEFEPQDYPDGEYAVIEIPEDYVIPEEEEAVEIIPEPVMEEEPYIEETPPEPEPIIEEPVKESLEEIIIEEEPVNIIEVPEEKKSIRKLKKVEKKNSFLTKSRIIRITIICALLTQINHAASLFYLLSDATTFSFIMSWVFAVSLESSIYIFTMFGKRNTAIFFGFVSWAVNILHYWFEIGLTQKFVAMNIISPIIPITIYFYSELIQEDRERQDQEELLEEVN